MHPADLPSCPEASQPSTMSMQQGHQCFVQGTGAAAERKRQENPSAPAVLFTACYDLKEKENVGPKQKFQLYQLVWTELAASMRKGAVPRHRARKHFPGKCPVGLLGKKINPCLSPGKRNLSWLLVCAHPLCSPGEPHLIPAAVRNAALLSWEQDKPTQAETDTQCRD